MKDKTIDQTRFPKNDKFKHAPKIPRHKKLNRKSRNS